MERCVFCQIVAKESPASVFYEDELVLGFLDIRPINPGHALIVPQKHAASLAELDEETGRRMWTVAQRTAVALRGSGVRCEGVNLWLADGKAAFQEVPHVHLHVVPRFFGDGFRFVVGPREIPAREELDALAFRIRQAWRGSPR